MEEESDALNNNSSNSNKNHNNSTIPDIDESDYDEDDDENFHPSKRVAIHEVNVSRLHKEFLEISEIGGGEFGSVFLVRHRLDGCLYAIKRSRKPVSGSADE